MTKSKSHSPSKSFKLSYNSKSVIVDHLPKNKNHKNAMGRISVTADQLTALGAASICNTSYGGFLGNIYYCTKKGEPLTGKMPRADGEGVYYKLGELGNHPEGVSSYDRLGLYYKMRSPSADEEKLVIEAM